MIALLLISAGSARADHEESAKVHYERGLSAYGLGHYDEAADEYEKAFALKPDPALLYNAAQSHRFAGHKERALQRYKSYLSLFGDDAPNRAEAQRHVDELTAALAAEQQATSTSAPPVPVPLPPPALVSAPAPLPSAPLSSPRSVGERPWYRRPWVIGVGAGAVVLVAGAIVLGVTLGGTTHNPTATFGTVTAR